MTEYNKVVYDGQTLIDLTNDDVTESDVLAGVYFHKADGTRSVGTLNVVDMFYPIGSYYETSDTTFNPNVTWGGTWVLETEGQVHVSSGTNYTVGGALTNATDGGSKNAVVVSHTHYVRIDATSQSGWSGRVSGSGNLLKDSTYTWTGSGYVIEANPTTYTGESGTDKNMPPYIVVNRWHRTA
jgi:hypothetical protein